MEMKLRYVAALLCLLADLCPAQSVPTLADTNAVLTMEAFILRAARVDTEFEAILVNELALQYSEALALPAPDLVIAAKQEYQAFLSQDRSKGATEVSLSKLFPRTGTDVSASYEAAPAFGSADVQSELSLSFAQPIARNAFGHSTRLLQRIVGMEVDVARHQVVEAYEDYLARIMIAYHAWYEAHENLEIARSSYHENLKLLDNIKQRQQQQVARPVDVNKIQLQVLAKQERVIELEEAYQNRLHTIERVVRHEGASPLVPEAAPPGEIGDSFDAAFGAFVADGRTFAMLRLLEEKSALDVDREADDLLPSVSLLLGYDVRGTDYGIDESDDRAWMGVQLEWPFPNRVARAEHQIAKLELRKAELQHVNTRHGLREDARNLFHEIQRERKLTAVAGEKIDLARDVLKDETENYSYGRVTLNDYISAVNVLDNNRFNRVLHEARHRKLVTEWLRLTDRLITRRQIDARHDAGGLE